MGEVAIISEDERKIAWAIYLALKRTGKLACVERPDPNDMAGSVIDGSFDLYAVARELKSALHDAGLAITGSNAA